MLRTTISLTRLEGSNKINVIPPEATAEIDCRVLPVEDTDQFTQRVREAAGDPQHIRVEQLMAFKPNTSSSETAAYKAIAEVAQRSYPGIKVVQALETGFTDSHYFREIGIQSYGWDAVERTSEESATAHGNNERVRIESFEKALPVFYAVVEQIAR
jgi:acetylornithine deacetylase/succinyl-diaminopimelate desuccinylase-like protein